MHRYSVVVSVRVCGCGRVCVCGGIPRPSKCAYVEVS